MYEKGWFDGTSEVALDQPFGHGDFPSPAGILHIWPKCHEYLYHFILLPFYLRI